MVSLSATSSVFSRCDLVDARAQRGYCLLEAGLREPASLSYGSYRLQRVLERALRCDLPARAEELQECTPKDDNSQSHSLST